MAFLRLNGYTIPVAKGGQMEPLEIGERSRAYDGTLLTDRRAIKRVWRFQTTPVTEFIATQISGIVQGQGDYWPFPNPGKYTSKGMAPITGSVTTLLNSTSPDGYAIYDQNGVIFEGNRGNVLDVLGHAVAVDSSCTNYLTAAESTGTAGSYVADNGAVLTPSSVTHFLDGASSLLVTGAAVVDSGMHVDYIPGAAGITYNASVYLWSSTAITLRLALTNGAVLLGAFTDVVMPGNAWRRVTCTGVTVAPLIVRLVCNNANSAVAKTWWMDKLQIEQRGFPTSWVVGGSSRGNGLLNYPPAIVTSDDFTMALWTKGPQLVVSTSKVLFTLAVLNDTGAYDYHLIYASGLSNEIIWTSYHAATATSSALVYITLWTNAWRHLTFVCRKNPESGEVKKAIYLDGVLVTSQSPTNMPTIKNALAFFGFDYMGGAGLPWDGAIDNVTWFPFAVDGNVAAAIYANDQSVVYPALLADDDLMPDSGATVLGKVLRSSYVGTQQGGTWRNNSQVVEFELEEV